MLQVRPPDDTIYVRFATKNPKKTRWVFHGEFGIVGNGLHLHMLQIGWCYNDALLPRFHIFTIFLSADDKV